MKAQLVAAALALTQLLASGAYADTTIRGLFMKQSAYSDDDVRHMADDFETANPGVKVDLEFVPYEALHDKTVASIGAEQGYDVLLFDGIWPGEFAKNGFLLDVTDRIPADLNDKVFQGAWTTVEYDGKRWGMPWILDTKYLFYNKEMLQKAGVAVPPKTWQELLADAKKIKAAGLAEYPIAWSWAQAEAVMCDYTQLVAAYKGDIMKDGKVLFDQGGGKKALEFMVQSIKDGLSNPHSTEFLEEDVRKVFSSGQAAFALNWTYMYNLANDPAQSQVAGKVGVEPSPGIEGISDISAVNGSMGLGIASNSKHPDEAWKFILFLTSQSVQDKYAKLSLPIWKASYSEPSVTNGQEELIAAAGKVLDVLYPRPVVPNYQEMSSIIQKAVQQALIGSASVDDALSDAARKIGRLR